MALTCGIPQLVSIKSRTVRTFASLTVAWPWPGRGLVGSAGRLEGRRLGWLSAGALDDLCREGPEFDVAVL